MSSYSCEFYQYYFPDEIVLSDTETTIIIF